jgi:subtilisin family serine protease
MKLFSALALTMLLSLEVFAQKKAPQNWFNLDPKQDKIWGISTEKAYKELPINKKETRVIVAVIDAGTDVAHEDLKANLWVNPKEISGNGKDDDNNGYIDDINGWNFIGGKDGNVNADTYESTRILAKYKDLPENEKPVFKSEEEKVLYEQALVLYKQSYDEIYPQYKQFSEIMEQINSMIKKTGSANPTVAQIEAIAAESKQEKDIKRIVKYVVTTGGIEKSPIMKQLKETESQLATMINFNLNKQFDPRNLVGDNYTNSTEQFYGNNEVYSMDIDHGTHVAGIITAVRNNDVGINGICDKAVIMTIKVVPNGDERDKDVANAIRYAADNGAKVINMSFGKKISSEKSIVDDAVAYALSKDVLLIHAAGNESEDLASHPFYPSPNLIAQKILAPNWIEVGASSWQKGKGRVASFSNYGKNQVEVFAPGQDVNSTFPGNKYESQSGTSMAAPVVAGVAALIRQNYPNLTAIQTKQIILLSALPCKEKIIIPGTKKKAKLKDISTTGGIVNAYAALVLAEKVSSGMVVLPKF